MLLECKNLFKEYARGKMTVPVLKDINLTVDEGEYIAIMGPSGSGKTTLMNLIGCLDVPTSGSLVLNEEELEKMNSRRMADVRNQVLGFVFQQADLLPGLSAKENVALPLLYRGSKKAERLQKAEEALIKVGLQDRMDFKPNQLSGGQCQRVAIARAIVGSPKLLLADEPTGALDSQSGRQVMELFRQLNDEGITIIMITHSQEVAEEADRIVYIKDGELSETIPWESSRPKAARQSDPQSASSELSDSGDKSRNGDEIFSEMKEFAPELEGMHSDIEEDTKTNHQIPKEVRPDGEEELIIPLSSEKEDSPLDVMIKDAAAATIVDPDAAVNVTDFSEDEMIIPPTSQEEESALDRLIKEAAEVPVIVKETDASTSSGRHKPGDRFKNLSKLWKKKHIDKNTPRQEDLDHE